MGDLITFGEWLAHWENAKKQQEEKDRKAKEWDALVAECGFNAVKYRNECRSMFPLERKTEKPNVSDIEEYAFPDCVFGLDANKLFDEQGYEGVTLVEGMEYALTNPKSLRHKLVCSGSIGPTKWALYFPFLDRTLWLRRKRIAPKAVAHSEGKLYRYTMFDPSYRFLVRKKPQ
mgnify:CR=1 FL=1